MRNIHTIIVVAVLLVGGLIAWAGFEWFVNRVYVPEGQSLMLTYKGPLLFGRAEEAEEGKIGLVEEGQIGVLSELRGPGRHFYCPIWYKRDIVDDVLVLPGQLALVTSKLGQSLPKGEFLVDGDLGSTEYKGILRKVFGPGRYRLHPYAYEFRIIETEIDQTTEQPKHSGWVEIPAGYVGVVTLAANDEKAGLLKGTQDKVLPPGIYPINPRGMRVDIVEIGYRESSIKVTKQTEPNGQPLLDESGEPLPVAETGINFPSNDGFEIQMDFTVIWGVMPEEAPGIVRTFGNVSAVEQKVILPQSESISRNNGSKLGAVELLIGESRQKLQDSISEQFGTILEEKGIAMLYCLTRHIYIPQEIRLDIQQSFVADELTLTREQEKLTAETEGDLREAEQRVMLEEERIRVETDKLVAEAKAEGDKTAGEVAAETLQKVAAVDRQIAELDAEKEILLGEAEAGAEKMQQEAHAEKFGLAVDAFGTPSAYTKWQFADGLPETIDLKLLYAGEGTLWTDLKGIQPTIPLRAAK